MTAPLLRELNKEQIEAILVDAAGTLFENNFSEESLFADAQIFLESFKRRELLISGKQRKIKTGLITNWGTKIHQVLRELELVSLFDVVVCRGDVARGKPSPEPFLYACEQLQLLPEKALHIGDSLYDDAFGAGGAGLQSIWLNRDKRTISLPDALYKPYREKGLPVTCYTFKSVLSLLAAE